MAIVDSVVRASDPRPRLIPRGFSLGNSGVIHNATIHQAPHHTRRAPRRPSTSTLTHNTYLGAHQQERDVTPHPDMLALNPLVSCLESDRREIDSCASPPVSGSRVPTSWSRALKGCQLRVNSAVNKSAREVTSSTEDVQKSCSHQEAFTSLMCFQSSRNDPFLSHWRHTNHRV
ncbi:hypothetical protein GWK47_041948 [Chionoecetes opilio]|uniref:Uncharacterized protein n=1 Tax=Chionoecetes opilio TaxID=41210 RepID=A0A8J5D0A5_CHIOP|nr:hypothetical protein GWK47_041948 [Chionoecetes opilio]